MTEFVEFFSGLTYTPNDVQENGTLVLRSSNVSNGEVVDADNIYVNPQVVNSENVKVGDIVVVVRNGSRSLIGKHAQIKAFMPNTVIGAFMTGIRSECPEFTNALLNTSRFEEEIAMNMGATINQITGYMFSKMEFKVPCLDEQKKIGEYFEKLDNLITLHQRQPFLHSPPDISLIVQLTPPFYTFSWEQRKLEDYLTVSAEKNTGNIYGRSDVLSVSGDYGIVNQIEFQGRSFAGASVSNYGVVQTGDVVYTKSPLNSNPYGIIKTNKGKPGIVSTLYAVYHPKENAFSDFIQVYFEQHARMNNYMHPLVNKGAKNDMKVSAENALKGPVCFPSRIEQESISAFFSVLDNLITLHQRKFEKLTNVKKSMLEKMFPQNGCSYPEIRFKGFTDAWEQRKFSEITFLSGEKNRENLPLESYSITNESGFVPQDEKFENGGTMREANKRMYYIVSPNSFAYNPARINVGSIGYQNTGKNVIVSSLYEIFKTSDDVDDRLLWHWFKSPDFQKLIWQLQEGGVRLYFYYDKLCMGEVSLPSLEEQRKIGKFFDTLDNLITLHQRELEKLQNIKKSMLEKMFVYGGTRKWES